MTTEPQNLDEQLEGQATEEEPVDVLDDKPLTGAEVRERIVDLSDGARDAAKAMLDDAVDVWKLPARSGFRYQFNRAKKFLKELGGVD